MPRNGAPVRWNCARTRASVSTRPARKTLPAPAGGPAPRWCKCALTPTRKTRGVPARIAPAGSAVDRFEESPTGDADSPREIWWTVSRNYTVLILSRDMKNTKFNQYLPVDLTSLNVSNSRYRKPVMFWRWRHHGVALWRHGRGAGDNCLLLTTASNVKCWADVANHMTRLWQAGDTENFERRIMG